MVQNTMKDSLGTLVAGNTGTTLTPTTLKSITQIFESDECLKTIQNFEDSGFTVPLPPPPQQQQPIIIVTSGQNSRSGNTYVNLDSKSWQGGTTTVVTPTKVMPVIGSSLPESVVDKAEHNSNNMQTRSSSRIQQKYQEQDQRTPKRSQIKAGGQQKRPGPARRPGIKTQYEDDDLSPEEAERLKMRRERNKAAAARCRKRRVDQINTLSEEVEQWESKKRAFEDTIAQLKSQKEELEYILAEHSTECKLNLYGSSARVPMAVAVKSEPPVLVEPVNSAYLLPFELVASTPTKPRRPLSLAIATANRSAVSRSVEGVSIDTPSNVIPSLSFDTLMSSTGLTPTTNIITPVSFCSTTPGTCSTQQRSTDSMMFGGSSSVGDLNTPAGECISLVSL